jgi:hypothetical protein
MNIESIQQEWSQIWENLIAEQDFDDKLRQEPSDTNSTFIDTLKIEEWFQAKVEVHEKPFDLKQFSTFEYRGTPCVPHCCYCKKIRDIHGVWHIIELPEGVEPSDTFCPDCLREHYAELTT